MKKIFFSISILLFTFAACAPKTENPDSVNVKKFITSGYLKDENIINRYHAACAFDRDPTSAWTEDSPDAGIGAYVGLLLDQEIIVDTIKIMPGFFDERWYEDNNRVKEIKIKTGGKEYDFSFPDGMTTQIIEFDEPLIFTEIIFIITDIYKGSMWDDTCISEIDFYYKDKKINIDYDKNKYAARDKSEADVNSLTDFKPEDHALLLIDFSKKTVDLPSRTIKEPVYAMPSHYLDDELIFHSLDYQEIAEQTAVVAKQGVYLYEDLIAIGNYNSDSIMQNQIIQVPKGTLIPIYESYYDETKDSQYRGLFDVNDHYNYWYKTEYMGHNGIIFGAYLAGVNRGYIHNVRLAYYYKKAVKQEKFYTHVGMRSIPLSIQACLKNDKIALEKVSSSEYILSPTNPDDLISLYQNLHSDRTTTTFITTDLIIHCLHLLFDGMLESVEKEKFLPRLIYLVDEFIKELNKMEQSLASQQQVLEKSLAMLKNYFQVAQALLQVAIISIEKEKERAENRPWEGDQKIEVDYKSINRNFSQQIQEELNNIYEAQGFSDSAVFGFKEDYSQYKPRGHYTKTTSLESYFRAMMWLGRIHFYIDNSTDKNKKLSQELAPCVLVLIKIIKANEQLFKTWQSLFVPITYLVGEPDDLSFIDIMPLVEDIDFDKLGNWLQKPENIAGFIEKAEQELRTPLIESNLAQNMETGEIVVLSALGFRLFGQRFTLDSFIHSMLSSPRVGAPGRERTMVKGLDVIAVFGNSQARELLKQDMEGIPGYQNNFLKLIDLLNSFDSFSWRKTFYNGYLRLVNRIATFEKGMGFYFTQKQKWNQKTLLTSHASWAELRHDTILYVKQSVAAEMGGMGYIPTYDIEPVPRPISYVEPNLGFFYWLQILLEDSIWILTEGGFMNDNYRIKFQDFKNIADNLTEIVEQEVKDSPISFEQNESIIAIPSLLARIVLPDVIYSTNAIGSESEFQMALIADVHTDANSRQVLEVGTGIPSRIYVALNDGQGGKRIAIGYTYSYYEFHQSMSNRLNDDEWKQKVYGETASLESYLPEWARDLLCNE